MSKFQLPIQKGTELFGGVMQLPPNTVVHAADPSLPEIQQVLQRHTDSIAKFYLAQAQNYALSLGPHWRARQDLPGLRMEYTNNQGAETLHLIPSAPRGRSQSAGEKVETEDWWQWAVIKLSVSGVFDSGMQGASFYATRQTPPPGEPHIQFPEGAAYDGGQTGPDGVFRYDDGVVPPVLAWPPQGDPTLDLGLTYEPGDNQLATLRVDMRLYPKVPFVISLYGQLSFSGFGLIGYHAPTTGGGEFTSTQLSKTDVGFVHFTDTIGMFWSGPYTNYGYTIADLEAFYGTGVLGSDFIDPNSLTGPTDVRFYTGSMVPPAPSIHTAADPAPQFGARYLVPGSVVYGPGHLVQSYQTQGVNVDPGTSEGYLIVTQWSRTINGVYGAIPPPATPIVRPVEVSGIGGFDWLDWAYSLHRLTALGGSLNYALWESKSIYPKIIPTGPMGTGQVSMDGYTRIGRVVINPKEKSIGFQPG